MPAPTMRRTSISQARESRARAMGFEPTGAAWETALADALQALLPAFRRDLSEFLSPAEGEAYDVARATLAGFHEAQRAALHARAERG